MMRVNVFREKKSFTSRIFRKNLIVYISTVPLCAVPYMRERNFSELYVEKKNQFRSTCSGYGNHIRPMIVLKVNNKLFKEKFSWIALYHFNAFVRHSSDSIYAHYFFFFCIKIRRVLFERNTRRIRGKKYWFIIHFSSSSLFNFGEGRYYRKNVMYSAIKKDEKSAAVLNKSRNVRGRPPLRGSYTPTSDEIITLEEKHSIWPICLNWLVKLYLPRRCAYNSKTCFYLTRLRPFFTSRNPVL